MKFFYRIVLLFSIFSITSFSAGAITASFTADNVSGCSPLVVHFTNTSTGATSYFWDLGNGITTALTNPSTSYITPGTYTVRLTAYGTGGPVTRTMTITVYPSPTVSFIADDTSVCPGTPITFTSTSIPGVSGAMTYMWNFGDGSFSTAPTPAHAYSTPGYFTVTLSVTNSMGCVSTLTIPMFVHIFTPPVPNFYASVRRICGGSGSTSFTNMTTGTPGFTYSWNFGDGGTSTLANPTHFYSAPGAYTVTLTVVDGNGCTNTLVSTAYIVVGTITAAFTNPATACKFSSVVFTNTSSTHISSSWDFGDGGTDTTNTGVHSYSSPGTYTVRLIVFDGFCYDTITHTITIVPGPGGSFTYTPLHACPPPVSISFTGTAPAGTTVTWLFGDGGTGTGLSPTHTYTRRGIDTIKMIVRDPVTGCSDTIKRIDTLYDLYLDISANPTEGCVPLTVNFFYNLYTYMPDTTMGARPYPFGISSFSWNFGDGSPTSSSPTPSHTYTAVGIYSAILTIVTGNGCVIMDTIQIKVGKPPLVTFTATPTHACYRDNLILFSVTVLSGPVDALYWIWGDGTADSSFVMGGAHHYIIPGTFTVTVIPVYNGCPGPPYTIPNYITIDSPKAIIVSTVLCSPRNRVLFGDSSLGDDTHLWIFGDGTTSTVDNPIHDYPAATIYTVTLTTYNAASGCRDTTSAIINLLRPIVDFTAVPLAICRDQFTTITATVTGGLISRYAWHSTGRSPDSTSIVYIDTFHVVGLKTITLITEDQNDCLDTLIKPNYITVAKPVANFTATPTTGCWPLNVTFTDASTDVPGTSFVNFLWDFGDGGTASVSTPSTSHIYTAAGTFTTQEIVTDNIGCKDTISLPLITVYRPHAVFAASNVFPCIGAPVLFTNTSTGITGSFWMFGDGDTSTANSPIHSYAAAGFYTVKLVVTDIHGCTDTATYINYINVTRPVAGFYMSDSFSVCPPMFVLFTNTSSGGAVSYSWDLGNGSTSVLYNPTNLYTTEGYDTVMLIARNLYGCTDTAIGHVQIFGYAGAFNYSPLTGCAPLTVYFNATLKNVPNIIWDFADGTTSVLSYTDSTSHTYTLPGAYIPKLILSDNTGCENSSVGLDTIKVEKINAGFTTEPAPVCLNTTATFKDTSSYYWDPVSSWYWTFSNGDTSTAESPTYYYGTPGTFPVTLVVTNSWGCTGTITQEIVVYPPPVVDAGPDTIVCLTDYATLNATGAVSYAWASPATLSCVNCNPTRATPDVPTTYTVTGTDSHGCTDQDTVTVYLKTKTTSVAKGDTEICQGVLVQLFDSGATKFTWMPPAGLSDVHVADPIASPQVTTRYMVIAQQASCIPDTNYVLVVVHPLPTVNAGPDQNLLMGSTAQLQATGTLINSYTWGMESTLSCDSCSNPVASMSVTTTYVVTVATDFGCKNSDSVTIHLYCDQSQIFMPNSFTPNGDGQNDVFYPRGKGVSTIRAFRIYNRWGELLFERTGIDINDASNAWDGSYKGATPRPDVYVYVVDAVCATGEPINIKGDVTIIR